MVYEVLESTCRCGAGLRWWRRSREGTGMLEEVFPGMGLCGCGRAGWGMGEARTHVTWCEEGCLMFFEEVS
jgi:hypothetical protein